MLLYEGRKVRTSWRMLHSCAAHRVQSYESTPRVPYGSLKNRLASYSESTAAVPVTVRNFRKQNPLIGAAIQKYAESTVSLKTPMCCSIKTVLVLFETLELSNSP